MVIYYRQVLRRLLAEVDKSYSLGIEPEEAKVSTLMSLRDWEHTEWESRQQSMFQ